MIGTSAHKSLKKVSRVTLTALGVFAVSVSFPSNSSAQERGGRINRPYEEPRYEAFNLAHELVLKKVIEDRFSEQERRVLVFHHFDEGVKFYRAKKFDSAVVEFQKALEIDPTYEMAREHLRVAEAALNRQLKVERQTKLGDYLRRAKRYYHNNMYEKTLEECEVALEIHPESKEAQKLWKQAQRKFENQMLRDLAQAMAAVIRTEYNKGIDDEYRFAIRADTQNLQATIDRNKMENLLQEGKEYFMQKKYGKAIETWEWILRQGPRSEDRQIVMELIDIARRTQLKQDKEYHVNRALHGWNAQIP